MRTASLHDDLCRGAEAIAEFMFGDANERRKVYHAADKQGLPVFRLGNVVCARKSTILTWIEDQERAAVTASKREAA